MTYVKECTAYVFPQDLNRFFLIFSSLVHFEFIFMYSVRKCSNFILLHVAIQFFQHHLLKRDSFLHCILASFINDKMPIGAWAYLWAVYLVPLVYSSVFVPVQDCLDDWLHVFHRLVRLCSKSFKLRFSSM